MQSLQDGILADVKRVAADEAARVASLRPPETLWDFAWRTLIAIREFFSSGVFFILIGSILLYRAYQLLIDGRAQSGFAFVLVVLGIAIMLYGTGTQGTGKIDGDAATIGKYNAAIAGGAGVLTFCIAWGIVNYSEPMKTAFQVEQKYIRVPLRTTDNTDYLDSYMWEFSVDGVGIPASRRGKTIELVIPYFSSEFQKSENGADQTEPDWAADPCIAAKPRGKSDYFRRTIRVSFQMLQESTGEINGVALSRKGNPEVPVIIEWAGTKFFDGGLDNPKYPGAVCVDLKSGSRNTQDSVAAGNRIVDARPAAPLVKPSEPALIPTQGLQ